jgi:hypothetical protein
MASDLRELLKIRGDRKLLPKVAPGCPFGSSHG